MRISHLACLSALALLAACGTNEAASSGGATTPDFVLGDGDGSGGGDTIDGGGFADAGGMDTGSPSLDVSITPSDGGVETDASDPDVPLGEGQICAPNSTACEGDVLLTCSADGTAQGRTRCAARESYCGPSGGGAACLPRVCTPDAISCSDDGAESQICDERGAGFAAVEICDEGCDAATGRCAGSVAECPDGDVQDLEPGEYFFNLCGQEDSYQHEGTEACTSRTAAVQDAMFRITLDAPGPVFLDLVDADDGAAIDTLLYVRRQCDDGASQIACSDDIPCDVSDIDFGCTGGIQVRQSRLELELDAGAYYVIADVFNYRTGGGDFGCGNVRLTATF